MKRIYHHFQLWEDWREGMYREIPYPIQHSAIDAAARLLRMPAPLKMAMRRVIMEWPTSTAVNLSNTARNRQAWLGQAACFLTLTVPDYLTKLAWHSITENQQAAANAVADLIIEEWANAKNSAIAKRT